MGRRLVYPATLVALCSACTTPVPNRQFNSSTIGFEQPSARAVLADAMELLRAGNPAAAVGRLHEVVARYPDSPESLEAQYQLAVAYESLGSLKDAISAYGLYVGRSPDGAHADDARRRMEKLLVTYEAEFPSADTLDEEIESLREQLQNDPESNELAERLANALWTRGDYEQAGRIYGALKDRDAEFARSEVFRNRVELRPDGSYTLLTPAELNRRERAQNPINVINLSSFAAIRDSITQVPRYFVVTGQAVNRSDSLIYGVEVTLTIYGFGGDVYDTQTVPIGTMRRAETRAFSVRFSNFRDLESIDRYDYTVSFRR